MSDNSITPISSVSLTAVSGTLPKAQVKTRVEDSSNQERSSKQIENELEQFGASSKISVHFRVNDETNELTVFVVDRNSHRVLRSIPISEFYKMPAGELLKLAA